jgi:hypothetical protein
MESVSVHVLFGGGGAQAEGSVEIGEFEVVMGIQNGEMKKEWMRLERCGGRLVMREVA